MFRIGQEIVCIDDSPGICSGTKSLVNGKIYTVLDIDKFHYPNVYVNDGSCRSWRVLRFRPLSDVLSEISIAELTEELVEC